MCYHHERLRGEGGRYDFHFYISHGAQPIP